MNKYYDKNVTLVKRVEDDSVEVTQMKLYECSKSKRIDGTSMIRIRGKQRHSKSLTTMRVEQSNIVLLSGLIDDIMNIEQANKHSNVISI